MDNIQVPGQSMITRTKTESKIAVTLESYVNKQMRHIQRNLAIFGIGLPASITLSIIIYSSQYTVKNGVVLVACCAAGMGVSQLISVFCRISLIERYDSHHSVLNTEMTSIEPQILRVEDNRETDQDTSPVEGLSIDIIQACIIFARYGTKVTRDKLSMGNISKLSERFKEGGILSELRAAGWIDSSSRFTDRGVYECYFAHGLYPPADKLSPSAKLGPPRDDDETTIQIQEKND